MARSDPWATRYSKTVKAWNPTHIVFSHKLKYHGWSRAEIWNMLIIHVTHHLVASIFITKLKITHLTNNRLKLFNLNFEEGWANTIYQQNSSKIKAYLVDMPPILPSIINSFPENCHDHLVFMTAWDV
jgi:hypothetical protein